MPSKTSRPGAIYRAAFPLKQHIKKHSTAKLGGIQTTRIILQVFPLVYRFWIEECAGTYCFCLFGSEKCDACIIVMNIATTAAKMAIAPETYAESLWNVKVPVIGCNAKICQFTYLRFQHQREIYLVPEYQARGRPLAMRAFVPW